MNIFAIIISFNPNIINLSKLVDSISKQNIRIILVDNGSNNFELIKLINDAKFIFLGNNRGIATAQNIGIRAAIDTGADHVILFDQDSSISPYFINNLSKDYLYIKNNIDSHIAVIGPKLFNKKYNYFYKINQINSYGMRKEIDISKCIDPTRTTIIISSGSLISIEILCIVGFMRDDYFIDYVDVEWCFRAISKGYHCYISPNTVMEHMIGDYNLRILGKDLKIHSPFRRYFILRNTIYMIKDYRYIPLLFSLRELVSGIIFQIFIIIFLKEKKVNHIKSLINSIIDGLLKKSSDH